MTGLVRTVLGDRPAPTSGVVYAHEHLIIDSPLIEARFPHIHLHDVDSAVVELDECKRAGVRLVLDAMPISAGRDVRRLAQIATRTAVDVVAATGLHHDRYYGPQHWSNHVSAEELAELFIADLETGVDEFDYTGPIVRRTSHRAGVIKVATSGEKLQSRDRRNLAAAGIAAVRTGAPVLTHCEAGRGALEQIERLQSLGVATSSIILSHVDKSADVGYLRAVADTGANLELDQLLRDWQQPSESPTMRALVALVEDGVSGQLMVGTDGARRSLWRSLGGAPGLAFVAQRLPLILRQAGLDVTTIDQIMRANAARTLGWVGRAP